MEALKIIALCVLAAIVYGFAQDQVTARVCLEYFTIGHPRIFATESPTLIALGWGVIATWWVGLLLGALLAFAATRGPRPRRTARTLLRPILVLLACTGGVALLAGLIGYVLARTGLVILIGPLAAEVPVERHAAFIADLWAHVGSYLAGAVGGIVLANQVWRSRRTPGSAVGAPAAGPRGG